MANLDSSWQASVIKLAQTGNSRAIAFWLNRDLVPQGICAQIASEPSGGLAIQIVSRQVPDCDKLVRYICHRLCKLDSEAIQQVRITAQMVGASEQLWEKSARIIPPSARQVAQPAAAATLAAVSSPAETSLAQPKAVPPAVTLAAAQEAALTAPKKLAPVVATRKVSIKASIKASVLDRLPSFQFKPQPGQPQPGQPRKAKSGNTASRTKRSLKSGLRHQLQALKLSSVELTDQSIRWFIGQKPAGRALVLGSAAITAFLIGCSFELAGYYVNPAAFQRSKASLTGLFHNAIPSGSVQTVSERVSIVRQPVLNPDNPSISLIFSNSDLLNRLPVSQRLPDQVNPGAALVTTVEAFRQADMLITNLNSPVLSAAATQSAKPKPVTINSPQPIDAEDQPQLSALPEDTDAEKAAGSEDHEAEKMNFIADEEAAPEDAEAAPAETSQQLPLTPQELLANRVNLVNLASSAVMPEGATQLSQALALMRQGNIYAVGAGTSLPEARRPQIFEVKGKRIAYFGYSDSSPRAASGITAGVNVSVNQQMQADIEAIRDQVDWVVVSVNWNRELRAYPEDWQINLTHAAVDYGADLVVGYHPTAAQGGEVYNGRAIVYSLGNAIDEYSEKPVGHYEAAALKVTLTEHVMQLEFLPLQVKRGQAQIAPSDMASKISQYMQQASSLFDQPLRSPTSLNSQVRLTLPAAPNSEMPTDSFIQYPAPPASPAP